MQFYKSQHRYHNISEEEKILKGKSYVEKCLWEYRENVAMLEHLRALCQGLMSVRGHSYEAHIAGNVTNPVLDITDKRLKLESRIARTELRVKPVERLNRDMANGAYNDRHIREVLKLRYMEHHSVDTVRDMLHISSSTYGRAKERLLKVACKYFGIAE